MAIKTQVEKIIIEKKDTEIKSINTPPKIILTDGKCYVHFKHAERISIIFFLALENKRNNYFL